MSREEAIKILDEYKHCFWDKLYEPICMAIKALEQEPCDKCVYSTKDGYCQYDDITETIPPLEPSGDLISRQAVEDALYEYSENNDVNYNLIITEYIDTIPSVNPQEPKTGHWIAIDEEPHEDYECDRCGYMCSTFTANIKPHTEYKYCPNCGARMVEPQESEDKE